MSVELLIQILTPAITFLTVLLARFISEKLDGTIILMVVVPALGALVAYLGTLIVPGLSWLELFLTSFGSTFIAELVRRLTGNKPAKA